MALISKVLEGTLVAGETSITFTDSDIPNSLVRVFSTNTDVIPVSRTLVGNALTIKYDAQTSNMGVAVELVKAGMTINNTLTSDATDEALSAAQGKALKYGIDTLDATVSGLEIPEDITDLDDVNVTSIQDGQVLAWDSDSSKFVNVDQSGGSSISYTSNEQLVGTYLGRNLYTRTFSGVPTSTGTAPYVTNITTREQSGIGSIVFAGGYLLHTNGNSLVLPCYVNTGNTGGVYTSALGEIRLYNTGVYTQYYLTLWYIKEVV